MRAKDEIVTILYGHEIVFCSRFVIIYDIVKPVRREYEDPLR